MHEKKWRCDYKNMILFKQEVSEAFVNIVPLDKNDRLSQEHVNITRFMFFGCYVTDEVLGMFSLAHFFAIALSGVQFCYYTVSFVMI